VLQSGKCKITDGVESKFSDTDLEFMDWFRAALQSVLSKLQHSVRLEDEVYRMKDKLDVSNEEKEMVRSQLDLYQKLSTSLHVELDGPAVCEQIAGVMAPHFPNEQCRFFYHDMVTESVSTTGSPRMGGSSDVDALADIVKCSLTTGETMNVVQNVYVGQGSENDMSFNPNSAYGKRRTLCIPLRTMKADGRTEGHTHRQQHLSTRPLTSRTRATTTFAPAHNRHVLKRETEAISGIRFMSEQSTELGIATVAGIDAPSLYDEHEQPLYTAAIVLTRIEGSSGDTKGSTFGALGGTGTGTGVESKSRSRSLFDEDLVPGGSRRQQALDTLCIFLENFWEAWRSQQVASGALRDYTALLKDKCDEISLLEAEKDACQARVLEQGDQIDTLHAKWELYQRGFESCVDVAEGTPVVAHGSAVVSVEKLGDLGAKSMKRLSELLLVDEAHLYIDTVRTIYGSSSEDQPSPHLTLCAKVTAGRHNVVQVNQHNLQATIFRRVMDTRVSLVLNADSLLSLQGDAPHFQMYDGTPPVWVKCFPVFGTHGSDGDGVNPPVIGCAVALSSTTIKTTDDSGAGEVFARQQRSHGQSLSALFKSHTTAAAGAPPATPSTIEEGFLRVVGAFAHQLVKMDACKAHQRRTDEALGQCQDSLRAWQARDLERKVALLDVGVEMGAPGRTVGDLQRVACEAVQGHVPDCEVHVEIFGPEAPFAKDVLRRAAAWEAAHDKASIARTRKVSAAARTVGPRGDLYVPIYAKSSNVAAGIGSPSKLLNAGAGSVRSSGTSRARHMLGVIEVKRAAAVNVSAGGDFSTQDGDFVFALARLLGNGIAHAHTRAQTDEHRARVRQEIDALQNDGTVKVQSIATLRGDMAMDKKLLAISHKLFECTTLTGLHAVVKGELPVLFGAQKALLVLLSDDSLGSLLTNSKLGTHVDKQVILGETLRICHNRDRSESEDGVGPRPRQPISELGIDFDRSLLGHPLKTHERVVGSLLVCSANVAEGFSERDAAVLATLAEWVLVMLGRMSTLEADVTAARRARIEKETLRLEVCQLRDAVQVSTSALIFCPLSLFIRSSFSSHTFPRPP
jgi:hypothetical protein